MDQQDLEKLLIQIGVTGIVQRGQNLMAHCPSGRHADRRPSWGINVNSPHMHGCFACFPAGTLVDTKKGKRAIETLRAGDFVLTANGKFEKVTACIENPKQKLWRLELSLVGYTLDATANHGIYCREVIRRRDGHVKSVGPLTKVSLGALTRNHYVRLTSYKADKTLRVFDSGGYCLFGDHKGKRFPKKARPTPELAELLGWYAAEGSISSEGRVVFFTLSSKEITHADRIESLLLSVFGLTSTTKVRGSRLDVVCCSVDLARFLELNVGKSAANKFVSDVLLLSDFKCRESFLDAYYLGDGHLYLERYRSAVSVSPKLANGVLRLAVSLGYTVMSAVKPAYSRKGVNHRESYFVKWFNGVRRSTRNFRILDDGEYVRVQSVKPLGNRKVPVFNITVEPTHRYSVNGIEVANCDFKGSLVGLLVEVGHYSVKRAMQVAGQQERLVDTTAIKEVLKWAEQRIKNEIKTFSSDYLLPYDRSRISDTYFKLRGLSAATVAACDLLYDSADSRVLFPWYIGGNLVAITGRTIFPRVARDGRKIRSYLEGSEKRNFIYLPSRVIARGPLVVVEGEIDALKVYEAGIHNVAALGQSRLSDGARDLMLNSEATEILMFPDDDEAGEKMAGLVEKGFGNKKVVRRIEYPMSLKKNYRHLIGRGHKLDPGTLSLEDLRELLVNVKASAFPRWSKVSACWSSGNPFSL